MLSDPMTTPGNNDGDGGDDGILSTEYSIQGVGSIYIQHLFPMETKKKKKKKCDKTDFINR